MKEIVVNSLYINSANNIDRQSGVFARTPFDKGKTVLYLDGEVIAHPTRTSIQIGDGKHIEDKVGSFINHSCHPTCKIDGHKVVALRDIAADEQITFDYSENETAMASPFVCACCSRLISGKLLN